MPATALAQSRPDVPRADGYARRRPEESVLYQVVEAHWPEFRQRADEAVGLPRFVVREFEEFLRCGILERGLARLACRRCGHEMVVAWSCKRRGWCPSCCGRRIADVAAHLVDAVLPVAPHRQWVFSLPWSLRAAVEFDRRLCADGRDRRRLERLCRYMARPPLCQERLLQNGDGRLRLSLKKAWKDGTHAILLHPLDLLARLCAIVPPPRFHMLHYHGVFAGGSAVRQAIVLGRAVPPEPKAQIPLFEQAGQVKEPSPARPPSRHSWPWLLRRVFSVDVETCPVPDGKGEMRLKDMATRADHIARVLAELGLAPRPPTRPSRIPAGQLAIPLGF